ncbi:MAG: hypothetical protein GWP09_02955 [Nitrospiraceae bacterium]|nr:hypothetical protein [Nitrospiraceae bacterium]
MKKNKKGATIAVNYIFLFLIATIVAMIVIAIVAKGSLNANKFICKLTGTCGSKDNDIKDAQQVNVTNCSDAKKIIVTQAQLCYELGREGQIKSDGEKEGVCYVIYLPKPCGVSKSDLVDDLNNVRPSVNFTVSYDNDRKAVVSYNYNKQQVVIS